MKKSSAALAQKPGRRKRFYTLEEFTKKLEAHNFLVEFDPAMKNFKMTYLFDKSRWGWMIHPETEEVIRRIRDHEMAEWDEIIQFNVTRLMM